MKRLLNTYSKYFINFIFIVFILLTPFIFQEKVFAENEVPFFKTSVLADMEKFNDEKVEKLKQESISSGKAKLLFFYEDSLEEEAVNAYNLYFYIYIPYSVNTDNWLNNDKKEANKGFNNVTLSINNLDYSKYKLYYIKSEDNIYKFMLMKEHDILYLHKFNKNKISGERVYSISEIEIFNDNKNVSSIVGESYKYKGSNKNNNLEYSYSSINTIELDVIPTFHRIKGANKVGVWEQLNTVYFAVPNEYFNDEYKVKQIKAEWNEFFTMPIYTVKNEEIFSNLNNYRYLELDNKLGKNVFSLYNTGKENPSAANLGNRLAFAFNISESMPAVMSYNKIDHLFYSSDLSVSRDVITDYVRNNRDYSNMFETSNELYATLNRKMGYNIHSISDTDLINVPSFDEKYNNWQKFCEYGFKAPDTVASYKDLKSIVDVSREFNIEIMSDNEISQNLYIDKNEIRKFRNFYNSKKDANHIILFRFAVTKTFSMNLSAFKNIARYPFLSQVGACSLYDPPMLNCANVTQEMVFLDFDIIQMKLENFTDYKVIPVGQSPIDIISPIEKIEPSERWITKTIIQNFKENPFFEKISKVFKYFIYGILGFLILLVLSLFIKLISPFLKLGTIVLRKKNKDKSDKIKPYKSRKIKTRDKK